MYRDSLASWHGRLIMFGRRCTNDFDNFNNYDFDNYNNYDYDYDDNNNNNNNKYDNNNHAGAHYNVHAGSDYYVRLNIFYYCGTHIDGGDNDNIGSARCDFDYDCRGIDSVAGFHLDCACKGFVRSGEHFFRSGDDSKAACDDNYNNNDIAKV
jgi:hypothetical protein